MLLVGLQYFLEGWKNIFLSLIKLSEENAFFLLIRVFWFTTSFEEMRFFEHDTFFKVEEWVFF